MINEETVDTMVRMAKDTMRHAYAPHTKMKTGACLLASDGTLYGACNIESQTPSLSCCAESVAMYKAISDSKREFDALAVVADTEEPFMPCGSCLQLMAEFGVQDIIMANMEGDVEVRSLAELFPVADATVSNRQIEREDEDRWQFLGLDDDDE